MTNREKFADVILDIACSGDKLAMRKADKCLTECVNLNCDDCFFDDNLNCCETIRKWAESEYIEKPVISKRDRAFLDYLKEEVKYIARDGDGELYTYTTKPKKESWNWTGGCYKDLGGVDIDLPMVKWSDKEPRLVEELKKLEVCENYEID